MQTQVTFISDRWLQFIAYTITAIFLLGFVYSPLGVWTGAILGAWFIGTQRPWRGLILLAGINTVLGLFGIWREFQQKGVLYAGWTVLAILISTLPFFLYRLVTQRRPGFLATLSLPLWGVVLLDMEHRFMPARISSLYSLAQSRAGYPPFARLAAALGPGAVLFFVYWFAAVMVWMWNHEFQARKIATGASVFGAVCVVAAAYGFFPRVLGSVPARPQPAFPWICLAGGLILSVWSFLQPSLRREAWANKTAAVALLQSPYTGNALHVLTEGERETLVSSSGERFCIRDAIPVFVEPEKLTGTNQKYNHLYETIGGFYDDSQRVGCAWQGFHTREYYQTYLGWLEIKPGDLALETSVGTGLNFKYLPRGVKLFGLDLSAEMLANCQANLRRWELDADLFLGNAEELPFASNSFDVVYHVGGINFFNDRAKAIREMIRVAKPGTRILIADETEKHVKDTYERIPITRGYFKDRQDAVSAPIDLVPPEMQEIHLEFLHDGRFYLLTFCKPAAAVADLG
jgi:ubiquinone/menaquinone biosynthesis C-methylase UbiE